MKKKLLIVLTILLIFLSHCDKNRNDSIKEIIINENSVILNLVPEKLKSIRISDLRFPNLFHDHIHVYVYGYSIDKGRERCIVRKFDDQLNLVSEKMFELGMGPNDLGEGVYFYPGKDFIYAPDNTQGRVNIFDKNFSFVKFIKLPRYLPITMIKNGRYFLGTHLEIIKEKGAKIYTTELVFFPEMKKNLIHTLGPTISYTSQRKHIIGEEPEFSYFYQNFKNIDRIYYINMKSYQISIYDFNGKIIKRVRLNVEMKKVPLNMKNKWLHEQSSRVGIERRVFTDWIQPASKVVPLEKGFVVIRRKDYMDECNGLVDADYFNFDLEMLGKVNFPCFYDHNRLTRGYISSYIMSFNGYLYLTSEINEEYYLEKWRLNE